MPTRLKASPADTRRVLKRRTSVKEIRVPYAPLDFKKIEKQAQQLADTIEVHFEGLAHILLEYESYEVVVDEVARTLDLLRNLTENKKYFKLRIGEVATFLPRNQPLYAFTCFVIVPSFMASAVHFRIPHSMRHFFPKLLVLLNIYQQFTNIVVSHASRTNFLLERTALRVNPKTNEDIPVTNVVIFTGMPAHADQLRFIFDHRTLFVSNGAGHNPVIASSDADIEKAVATTLTLQLYNQGQDCAAPNAVLVHKSIFPLFLHQLRDGLRAVGVGDYRDRQSRVGPISDPKDLVRIQDFLIENRRWLDSTTPGTIRTNTATLEPTIIAKPLREGGNFTEIFAPIIFLQEYEKDSDLALYFEDSRYAPNAMYVTLYGTSGYIRKLIGRSIGRRVLHGRASFLHNTHLHAPGVERGIQPYGGSGCGASSLSIKGRTISKATLPQRDIYEWVAKPIIRRKSLTKFRASVRAYSLLSYKNIRKLLKLKPVQQESLVDTNDANGVMYIDTLALQVNKHRYVKVSTDLTFQLLEEPNRDYIARLRPPDLNFIRVLRKSLLNKRTTLIPDLTTQLYALTVRPTMSKREKRVQQLQFFQHIYNLLFGHKSGPRLGQFLAEADRKPICELLDV